MSEKSCDGQVDQSGINERAIGGQADDHVSVELCSIHFSRDVTPEQWTPFLLFADGAAAALVTARPQGIAINRFQTSLEPQHASAMRLPRSHSRNSSSSPRDIASSSDQ